MIRRRVLTALMICLAVLVASPPPAPAQAPSDSGVGELWKEYPLEEGRRLPEEAGTASPSQQQGRPPRAATATATPSPAQARAGEDRAGGGGGSPLSATWIALLIALLVVVDVAIFLRVRSARRRRRRETSHPVWGQSSSVYAKGTTERDGIGAFQGFVYAMASGNGSDGERMLCVHDPTRDEPIWVRRSEVASLTDTERVGSPSPAPAGSAPIVTSGEAPSTAQAEDDDGLERRWQEARRRADARRKAIGR